MTQIESDALVVRTVEVGESDVVATLMTERAGKIAALARGARKGSRRMGGALEPVHTVSVLLDDRGQELTTLKEARIVRLRSAVASNLEALEAAGIALRWARHVFPLRTPEPGGWLALVELLDGLDAGSRSPHRDLARAGLSMLSAIGYGLDFARCVACGRVCPDGRRAGLDQARGGLVCRSCGGGSTVIAAGLRRAAMDLARGGSVDVTDADARQILALVDRAMALHAGFDR